MILDSSVSVAPPQDWPTSSTVPHHVSSVSTPSYAYICRGKSTPRNYSKTAAQLGGGDRYRECGVSETTLGGLSSQPPPQLLPSTTGSAVPNLLCCWNTSPWDPYHFPATGKYGLPSQSSMANWTVGAASLSPSCSWRWRCGVGQKPAPPDKHSCCPAATRSPGSTSADPARMWTYSARRPSS